MNNEIFIKQHYFLMRINISRSMSSHSSKLIVCVVLCTASNTYTPLLNSHGPKLPCKSEDFSHAYCITQPPILIPAWCISIDEYIKKCLESITSSPKSQRLQVYGFHTSPLIGNRVRTFYLEPSIT